VALLILIGLVAFGFMNCGEGMTQPFDCVDDTVVLMNDPAYIARTEPLQDAPGRLSKNCATNPRYCYYLGGEIGVYTLGNSTILDNFVGDRVLIVGKVVFPATGPGEVWAGTICRFTG
jgi:hypothetical protein